MEPITLYQQDRFRYVFQLSEEHRASLMLGMKAALRESGCQNIPGALFDAATSRVVDLEDTVSIRYVVRKRHPDLSQQFHEAEMKRTSHQSGSFERNEPER